MRVSPRQTAALQERQDLAVTLLLVFARSFEMLRLSVT